MISPPSPELVVPPDLVVVTTVADGRFDVLVPTTRMVDPWALVVRVMPTAEEPEVIVTLPPTESVWPEITYTLLVPERALKVWPPIVSAGGDVMVATFADPVADAETNGAVWVVDWPATTICV